MAYESISEYGVIGDMHTAALVARDGSIDWLCLPEFDSPWVFGALLDDERGGHFSIFAPETEERRQHYYPDSNVLLTPFPAANSVAQIADFMPIHAFGDEDSPGNGHETLIVRHVKGVLGRTMMRMECFPRLNYSRDVPEITPVQGGVIFSANGQRMGLSAPAEFVIDHGGMTLDFTLGPGESITLVLQPLSKDADELTRMTPQQGEAAFHQTVDYWRDWVQECTYQGRWREMIVRSLLILKLLTYAPTGAIVAAPTSSTPERIGGIRNWEYRHVWLRDAAFTLEAFMRMGYMGEARAFMRFLGARMRDAGEDGSLQVMYGIRGEPELTNRPWTI